MQVQLKPWGNSQGIRFSRDSLKQAGFAPNEVLTAEISEGRIVLTSAFRHKSLRERAAAFGGHLNLSDEMEREAPAGSEVW